MGCKTSCSSKRQLRALLHSAPDVCEAARRRRTEYPPKLMREVRLIAIARSVGRHGQIAPLHDITDRCSHPEPAKVTAVGDADLSFEDVLKTRRRKPGIPGGGRNRWPSLATGLRAFVTNDPINRTRYAQINLSPRPGIRKINQVRNRRSYPLQTIGIFINRTNGVDLTAFADQRAGKLSDIAHQRRQTLGRHYVWFGIEDS